MIFKFLFFQLFHMSGLKVTRRTVTQFGFDFYRILVVSFVQSDVKMVLFSAPSQNCEKWLLASSCLSVRPSVSMEQLGFHWTDFHKIWYLKVLKKSVEKIQVSLKSDKNRGYFYMKTNIHFFITSRSFFLRMRNVSDKSCKENQNTKFGSVTFFFSKIVKFMR